MPGWLAHPQSLLHPATRLLIWAAAVIAMQRLPWPVLAALLLVPLFTWTRPTARRWRGLMRRSRWLLLSLFLVFSLSMPGDVWWPALAALSPTREGVLEGGMHALRLSLILALVAWLLETTSEPQLMAAIYTLSRPFAVTGLRPERVVVRLALVLRYVEELPPPGEWRRLLDGTAQVPGAQDGKTVSIEVDKAGLADFLAAAALALALVWLVAGAMA